MYATLGVARGASHQEIRRAYRRLSLTHHPDKVEAGASEADKETHRAAFLEVARAYETLGNEGSRREYDRQLVAAQRGGGGNAGRGGVRAYNHAQAQQLFEVVFNGVRVQVGGGGGTTINLGGFSIQFG